MDSRIGNGRPPGNNFPLTRQGSIYSLTFDELQNTMGSIGKDFGSMNMDELLKNIWNAEEMQTIGHNNTDVQDHVGVCGPNLQQQGSLTLPRTLSQKTVDEVWKDLSKEYNNGFGQPNFPQSQQTLGEMTLEEFLVKAGVVREETQLADKLNDNRLFSNLTNSQNNPGFGVTGQIQNAVVADGGKDQISFRSANPTRSAQLAANLEGGMGPMVGLGATGGVTVAAGSPAVSSYGLAKGNGDISSVSPAPYAFNGVLRGRRSCAVEKVVERRHKRMIKNRESAARSRARKQAYTMELEAEVSELKQKNQELKRKQVMEMMNMQPGTKRNYMKKTLSGPW